MTSEPRPGAGSRRRSEDPTRLFPPPRVRSGDVIAGIGVAFVLIPQALAYADIVGVPPAGGLYAATLPPIAAAIAASSPYLQTGPVAMTAFLTFGALGGLAEPGTAEYVGLAALLALVVGTLRLLIGLAGAGAVSYFISRPVLIGFTSAAALLIVASQLPAAVGSSPPSAGIIDGAVWVLGHPSSWDWSTTTLAALSAILMLGARRISPLVPGVVIAVVLGLAWSRFSGFDGAVIGDLPSGLPPLSLALPWSRVGELLLPGAVIALVGFAEPAAIALAYAAQDRSRWNANREFVGQGLANLAAGVSGGFPVGGSFGRSAVNRLSGARTRWSGAITGATVLAFLPIAGVLEDLPRAVLAGIVIAAVVPLVRIGQVVGIARHSPVQGAVAAVTFLLTLALAPRVDEALLLGIGLGIAVHLIRELRVDVSAGVEGDSLIVTPAGVLYFGSAHQLAEQLLDLIAAHPEATRLVFDLEGIGRLDYTGAVTLRALGDEARDAGLQVELVRVPPAARRIVESVWHDRPGRGARRGS
jgi:SulP family sulfate permease